MRELFLSASASAGKANGKWRRPDGLTPILERLADADGIIFGSPVLFPQHYRQECVCSSKGSSSSISSTTPTNPRCPPETDAHGVRLHHERALPKSCSRATTRRASRAWSLSFRGVFSKPENPLCERHVSNSADYSKYKADRFSETDKARHREQQFPIDCQKAFELGKALVKRNG